MYDKVSTSLNFVEREKEILEFWRAHGIVEKTFTEREGAPVFTFFDGPPTANGRPHIGHVETRAIKDLIPRYKTMKGYQVFRKAGWDTHGLPVELEVEKALGINGKPQIEQYGIEPFIKKCKESVWKYKTEWEQMSDRVGYWADMQHPYVTYDDNYIESVWWSLKTIADKGLLYKGHKVVPYCPRCGTALSSHEVAQGYKDVTETSVYVKFRVRGQENTFLLAWTTTPWTLPSNVALVVNEHEDYVYAEKDGETYILAKALCEKVVGEGAKVLRTVKGAELIGTEYEPLYPFAGKTRERGWYVVADDYVTLTDGTGIVHTAPAFGEDDARVGRENNLPFVQLVNTQGRFVDAVTPWAGMFVKEADPLIIEDLKASGKLFAAAPYTHSYPFCWRCDTPLLYYARASWFIKMTAVRDKLVENNRRVNWFPDNIQEGRMGNFLENVIDWGLSRERYWGTPLPVWVCDDCGHTHVIGSKAELRERGDNVPEDIELHKPYVDKITLTCEKCGGVMHRVPEVIDCWYDSGSMPFAQWHYPFENKEIFEKNFPAQFISEAVDQTRGWFYTLLAISTLLFDRNPFENCVVLGLVQDKNGIKMSKHLGNVISPWDVLDKQGADAVRWYFYASAAPWLPSRFSHEAVSELQRKYMGTLWNTYAFFVLYANIDNFDPKNYPQAAPRTVMDRWVLSKLNTLVKTVDEDLDSYKITEAARALSDFVDELSNWYVRRGRDRYWGSGMTEDKLAAYQTLYTVLVTLAKLTAPFTPFLAESIYQNLVRKVDESQPESVHLCAFPAADESLIDSALEDEMELVLKAVNLGRAARNAANLKIRQPLAAMYVKSEASLPEEMAALVADELNVKSIRFVTDARHFTTYQIKPQMRTLGPRYGKLLGKIGQHLAAADGNAVVDVLDEGKNYEFDLEGTHVSLAREDMLIAPAQKPGYVAQSEGDFTVVLDANLTDELRQEGYLREVISKVQTMRKEAGFEVTDRIRVYAKGSPVIENVVSASAGALCEGVLAVAALVADAPEGAYAKAWDLNGEKATLAVEKATLAPEKAEA